MFHDVTPSTLLGRGDEFISAPRIDNLCSSWAAIEALLAADATEHVNVVALFDHEEIGSTSNRGAGSSLVESVLERITIASAAAERNGTARSPRRSASPPTWLMPRTPTTANVTSRDTGSRSTVAV